MTGSHAGPRTAWLPLAVAAAVGAVVLLAAPAHGAAPYGKATCKSKSASFLFWPKGHPKLQEPGFGKFKIPHLEIYGGLHTTGFPSAVDAYVDPRGAAPSRSACKVGRPEPLKGKIPNAAKRTKATNVQCRFRQKMILEFTKRSDGIEATAILKDGTKVLTAKMFNSGSSIAYDKERCKPKPPPK